MESVSFQVNIHLKVKWTDTDFWNLADHKIKVNSKEF
jgi:hypothetical protein